MNIRFLAYHVGGPVEYRPGDIANVPDDEAARLIDVGGARALTDEEAAALPVEEKPAAKSKAKG